MAGDFQELLEALEHVESGSANMHARVKSLRQTPTPENVEALMDELRALEKELKQLKKYFSEDSPAEMLDVLRAISDTLYGKARG